jgi:hypothetical protein
LLSGLEWKLGQVLHVVAPTLWVKLTRRAQVPGFEKEGHFVRASLIHDLCRNYMVPQLQAVRQIAPNRRLIAKMDIIGDHYTLAVGQSIPLINLNNKLGFKEAWFKPELQIGADMRAMAPTVKVLVGDDDYKGALPTRSFCPFFSHSNLIVVDRENSSGVFCLNFFTACFLACAWKCAIVCMTCASENSWRCRLK